MSAFASRPFAGESDFHLLIDFVRRRMIERWPGATYWHPGDIVWQLYQFVRAGPLDEVRLWFDDEGLAAFAIFEPPLRVQADLRSTGAPFEVLYGDILQWAADLRAEHLARGPESIAIAYQSLGTSTVVTAVLSSDAARAATLERHGFRRADTGEIRFAVDLRDTLAEPRLPDGYRVRHATDADLEERVDLHRDAWSVWGPSGFTARNYGWLRHAPLYDERLDVVVEDTEGRLVSYCVGWADPGSGFGTFEPTGTRPAYAGRGLGKAAILGGLQRMRDHGLHTALVSTASVNPAAQALYRSCGFRVIDTESFWAKPVTG